MPPALLPFMCAVMAPQIALSLYGAFWTDLLTLELPDAD